MFMDTYVERFREGMDDEFQLDVMYRAYVIFAGFSANVSLACAAVLSWIFAAGLRVGVLYYGRPVVCR